MSNCFLGLILSCAMTSAVFAQPVAQFASFTYTGDDQRFQQPYDLGSQYLNPIVAGFYPDPSVCRVDDTFYLVNSSFSFFPGVPIFESKDLVNWQQIGHVLDRPSQLPLEGQGVSSGIYAPDIKYNAKNKTFYMITTNVGKGNFFVKTTNLRQGWSEPVYLPQIDGIDPSFLFDDNGRAYIVHNAPVMGKAEYDGQRAIRLLEFDVKNECIIGEPHEIVRGGTHVTERPIWIEGPHLYRIGKYYYLMCAEGGTADAHSEVVFRAPLKADLTKASSWEECPFNPILTQRDLSNKRTDRVICTGHADLVQDQQKQWWAVFLGCRPYERSFYNTGRETFLLPVTWRDGWPVILEKGQAVPTVVNKKGVSVDQRLMTGNFTYTDRFDSSTLHHRWIFLRNPDMKHFAWGQGKGLTIKPASSSITDMQSPSALFCRQQHTNFTIETELTFTPENRKQLAGLALLQNEQFNFVFGKTRLDGQPAVVLKRTEKTTVLTASAFIDSDQPLRLRVSGSGRYYSFYYAVGQGPWQTLATGVDAVQLSTDRSGGFVGTCFGPYATNANQ